MKRSLVRLFCCIALVVGLISLAPQSSEGQAPQPVIVKPTELYRFNISPNDGGFLLTGSWQEGLAWGYNPEVLPMRMNRSNFGSMGIYVPPAGYTPDPAAGLVPLHRWLVIQNGWRNYYYYSTFFATNLGSDYHYHGIQGYVFPAGQPTFRGIELTRMSSWYSQSWGYWNGTGAPVQDAGFFIELPPANHGFVFHGTVCSVAGAVTGTRFPPPPGQPGPTIFDVFFFPPAPPPPPPPPPPCNAPQSLKNKCAQLGGWWSDESCSCEY